MPPVARAWLTRLFTSPDGRDLLALDSKARRFPPKLRAALIIRDDLCRHPYCDATIRHADHVHPAASGGTTEFANGAGLSARCNYLKDLPGFSTRVLTREEVIAYAEGDDCDDNTRLARTAGPHTQVTELTTPTGRVYLSVAPPLLTG